MRSGEPGPHPAPTSREEEMDEPCEHAHRCERRVTLQFELGGVTFVLKDVPAQECPECGHLHVEMESLETALAFARAALEGRLLFYGPGGHHA